MRTRRRGPVRGVATISTTLLETGSWYHVAGVVNGSQQLIRYIPFPDALRGKYQCYTQADLSALRASGCDHAFADVATGVGKYVQWLAAQA